MFGDILSNEAAELSGGIGLGGSLNAGFQHAAAQAAHGSAPELTGQDIANPVALIRSTGMLLQWLGIQKDRPEFLQAAKAVNIAIQQVLEISESRTHDLGGELGTQEFATYLAKVIADN
jgi:3-isopropylmalate dehydrogenase